MLHKHHIIPKHIGGSDDPSNIIEVTIEKHAHIHKQLYEKHERWQDYVAWKALSGQITGEEAHQLAMQFSAIKRTGMKRGKYKRVKDRPLGISAWNKGLKNLKLSNKMKLEKCICPHCGKIGGSTVMQKWHFNKCHILVGKQLKMCPHCEKIGRGGTMHRWHFDNCKQKEQHI